MHKYPRNAPDCPAHTWRHKSERVPREGRTLNYYLNFNINHLQVISLQRLAHVNLPVVVCVLTDVCFHPSASGVLINAETPMWAERIFLIYFRRAIFGPLGIVHHIGNARYALSSRVHRILKSRVFFRSENVRCCSTLIA